MVVFFTKNCGFFFFPPKRSVPVVRYRWKCCVMLVFCIKTLWVFSSVDGFALLIPALWDVFNGSGNPSVCDTQRGGGGEAVWGSGPPREWKVTPTLPGHLGLWFFSDWKFLSNYKNLSGTSLSQWKDSFLDHFSELCPLPGTGWRSQCWPFEHPDLSP